jgi:hypothetical protein
MGQEFVEQFVGLLGRRQTALLADRSAPLREAPQLGVNRLAVPHINQFASVTTL